MSLIVVTALVSVPSAQEKVDRDINWKIRREATDNSQILKTLHILTDLYGPRLTGSPNLKAAQEWVVKQTTEWGLKNAKLSRGASAIPAGPTRSSRCTWCRP